VLPVVECRQSLVFVECIGRDDRHCVDVETGAEFLIVRIYGRDAELIGDGPSTFTIPPAYRHDLGLRMRLNPRDVTRRGECP
jgi:hypothetical protein